MKTVITALEAYLATRRVTSLMVEDTITEPVRQVVWDRVGGPESTAGYMLTCRKCSSVWAGAGVIALSAIPGGRVLTQILALSEASIITDSLLPTVMEL